MPKVTAAARAKHETVIRQAGTRGGPVSGAKPMSIDLPGAPLAAFYAYGLPSPQGSKRFAGFTSSRKPVLKEMSEGLGPWRDAIRGVMESIIRDTPGWKCIDFPVIVQVVFNFEHTAASRKRGDIYPTKPPDLDKLQRALGDAISARKIDPKVGQGYGGDARTKIRETARTQSEAKSFLRDDSLIVGWFPMKLYAGTPALSLLGIQGALKYPGAAVFIYKAPDPRETPPTFDELELEYPDE